MYDLIVIGAGPGGYYAAVFAAQNGMKTAIFEPKELGGVCLNWGCIPTKSLLKAAENIQLIKEAANWGINVHGYEIDLKKIISQSRETVKKLNSGIEFLLKSHKVDWLKSYAKITNVEKDFIEISDSDGKKYQTKKVIIASGSRQRTMPNLEFSQQIWGVKEALTPEKLPKKLAIIGAGVIGIEFANFYNSLGTEITIFEIADKILGTIDSEMSQILQRKFEKDGIKFRLNTKTDSIKKISDSVQIQYSGTTETFDAVLICIGVIPNIELFSNEFPNLATEKGYIKTDENHETSVKNIFAIGDCASPPWLAHKATFEGIRAVEFMKGKKLAKMAAIPMCIYTNPQIASIGKTEEELREVYKNDFDKEVKIGKSNFAANGKALAIKESTGFVKILLSSKTGELFGLHIIGPEATEIIHSAALGMQLESLPEDWISTIFPHPTLSETIHEAFMNAMYE